MKIKMNVRTPWGRMGDVVDVEELTPTQEHHVKKGTITVLKEGEDYDPPFRPDEHTVEEINSYLAEADYPEQQRVLAEEERGKNRRGVKVAESGDEDQD